VNVQSSAQPLRIDLQGVQTVKKEATGEMLTGELSAVNTAAEPRKVVPRPISISNAGKSFTHELPANSISVIRLKTR
jgi:alpha-L-arabinofuranosidase